MIIALLQSDLPMLTGIPLNKYRQSTPKSGQLVLNLRWVLLNKRQGQRQLALTISETQSVQIANMDAWV